MFSAVLLFASALLCGFTVEGRSYGNNRPVQPVAHCDQLLSRGKPTGQSSTYPGGRSSNAVDGRWNPNWGGHSCTHTQRSHHPYWWVDLGRNYRVTRVVVQNRADCCAQRLSNIKVTVGDSIRHMSFSCGYQQSPAAAGELLVFECSYHTYGRYVEVQLLKTDYLTLCEVAVFGIPV